MEPVFAKSQIDRKLAIFCFEPNKKLFACGWLLERKKVFVMAFAPR